MTEYRWVENELYNLFSRNQCLAEKKAALINVTGGVTFQWDGGKCLLNLLISVAD